MKNVVNTPGIYRDELYSTWVSNATSDIRNHNNSDILLYYRS